MTPDHDCIMLYFLSIMVGWYRSVFITKPILIFCFVGKLVLDFWT